MSGWIKLHRGWRDNPIFRGTFSRADAWLWLIENAAWKPSKAWIKGESVDLKRGDLSFSVRFLAERWGWSKSAVERFLIALRHEGMIETRSKTGTTAGHKAGQGQLIITICNYGIFQGDDLPDWDNRCTETGTTAGQQRDKEEEEEEDKKNIPVGTALPSIDKLVFDHGLLILTQAGCKEQQARGIVGRWKRDFGAGETLAAIGKAQREGAVDPVAFITACLKRARHATPGDGATAFFGHDA